MPLIASVLAQAGPQPPPCGPPEEAGLVCTQVFDLTGNAGLARVSELFVVRPAKIVLIVVLAWLVTRLLRRGIRRFVRGLRSVQADVALVAERSAGTLLRTSPVATARASQRAETIGSLLGSVSSFAVWTVAVFMAFAELGLEIGPLLAGAGIIGVALGFGAQNLVRDFLTGLFMLLEDQYGVGDVIDAGPATGIVEGVSLRTTRLRDVEGNVWHIPNGAIDRVANKSQQWSRALLDIEVAYGTDVEHGIAVIKRVADEAWREEAWSTEILEEPEVWGVERLGADGMAVRLVVKTKPLSQWKVARELRARIKRAFETEGIEIPFPQRVVWHRGTPVGGPAQNGG
jgi:small conductance mechanosensitive channel